MDNTITSTVHGTLSPLGWTRKDRYWYFRSEEMIRVLNVQKSQYGDQYYINLGIWLTEVETKRWPKESECHMRTRAEILAPAADHEINGQALDMECAQLGQIEREAALRRLITTVALPFFELCASLPLIAQAQAVGRLAPVLMGVKVRTLLERHRQSQPG